MYLHFDPLSVFCCRLAHFELNFVGGGLLLDLLLVQRKIHSADLLNCL